MNDRASCGVLRAVYAAVVISFASVAWAKDIFVATTGSVYGSLGSVGIRGYYWSSTGENARRAWNLYFYDNDAYVEYVDRSDHDLSVRAVRGSAE